MEGVLVKCRACGGTITQGAKKCGCCGLILQTHRKEDATPTCRGRDKIESQETEAARVASEYIQEFQEVVTSFMKRYQKCFEEDLFTLEKVYWKTNYESWQTCHRFVSNSNLCPIGIWEQAGVGSDEFQIEKLDFDKLYKAFDSLGSLTLFHAELETIQTHVLTAARPIAAVPGIQPEEHWEISFVQGMRALYNFLLARSRTMQEWASIQEKYTSIVRVNPTAVLRF